MHGDVALDGSMCVSFWFDVESLSEWVRVVVAIGVRALIGSIRGQGNLVVVELRVHRERQKKIM